MGGAASLWLGDLGEGSKLGLEVLRVDFGSLWHFRFLGFCIA